MRRQATAISVSAQRAAQRAPLASDGAVAFAVRDGAGRGRAIAVDATSAEAIVFGSAGSLRVTAAGVLPAHFVVLRHEGVLMAASASAINPAILNGAALPTTWTVLEVPSRIRIGAAAVDFFFVRESGTRQVDRDIEKTVTEITRPRAVVSAQRSPPQAPPRTASTRLPRLSPPELRPPPRRTPTIAMRAIRDVRRPPPSRTDLTPVTNVQLDRPGARLALVPPHVVPPHVLPTSPPSSPPPPRDLLVKHALAVKAYLEVEWSKASTTTRVLVGVVAILLVFLLTRSVGGSGSPRD